MTDQVGLWRWSGFAAVLAMAGLPIYIHAPAYYAAQHGIGLGVLGVVLAALRLVDVVQDPALGWLAERSRAWRSQGVALAVLVMAVAMLALFWPNLPLAALPWFALSMFALFTAWSFLSIVFYAEGVARAVRLGPEGHLRLAGWREGGALVGVCLAAVAPLVLTGFAQPYALFAAGFALLALLTLWTMRGEWRGGAALPPDFRGLLADPGVRGLLLLALANGAPAAVSSTLFLFFVEDRLQSPSAAGPLLLLFFLSAAVAVPLWTRAAARHGIRHVLTAAMLLALVAFSVTLSLGAGDVAIFAVISALSGAAMGADLSLLPAQFARQLARSGGAEAAGFALWSFMSKLTLGLAALVLLPVLDLQGFRPGQPNDAKALVALTLAYGGLPCLLKLVSLALLWRLDLTEASHA
ncbi:MFS transporter [Gemmobacter denitrificans]|uniref:MFS transporter n=1 Tax=Gemmobacter denitrificans TaxID=3123040 RepID=A0ABU8BSU3_9RHOB